MTKGKKWTLRLLGVAALALLICLCLLGSTMARYTSSGTGSGSLTVALWDVETAELTVDGEQVSPAKEAYGNGTGDDGARENISGWVGSFTIVNNSDVDALVTFEAGSEYTIDWPDATDSEDNALYEDPNWIWGEGWTDESLFDGDTPLGKAQTNAYGSALMLAFGGGDTGEETFESVVNAYGIFSLTFGFGNSFENGGSQTDTYVDITELTDDYLVANGGVKVESGKSVNIYAEVVWTSIDESKSVEGKTPTDYNFKTAEDAADWEAFSDAVDTILGMYAQKLTFGVTWTAVQASVLPPE